jgi:hypothetical protein
MSISELARAALKDALEAVRARLAQGAMQQPALNPSEQDW